ncbi:MAG: Shedu immune nuclease family protein [Dolichospermum sp.]
MNSKVDFLAKEVNLRLCVQSSTTDENLHKHLHHIDRKNIQLILPPRPISSKSKFVDLVLKDDLQLNINTDSLSKCKCYIPALDSISDSVNMAATLISEKLELHRRSHTKSVFRDIFFQDTDCIWKPLQVWREKVNPLFQTSRNIKKITDILKYKVTAPNAFNTILNLLSTSQEISELLVNLEKEDNNIREVEAQKLLNTLVGVDNLKKILKIWTKNQENSSEEFWHELFAEHSVILSQIFSTPVNILRSKAYVGGKKFDNKGGKYPDYLMIYKQTRNTALIEIKTPQTKLLSSEYRSGIYQTSPEISGAITQLLIYRDQFLKDYYSLVHNFPDERFYAFNPQCILIAGNAEQELCDSEKKQSFELSRSNSQGVQIVTYDEVFEKLSTLVNLLEGK